MRTTIDIPDEVYRRLKVKAAIDGESIRQIALRGIQREIEGDALKAQPRVAKPILKSDAPGSIRGDNEQINRLNEGEIPVSSSPEPKKPFRFPVIRSSRPGSLEIDNETIYDLIDFP